MIAYYNPDGSRDFAVTTPDGKYWNWNSPSRGVFNLTGSGDLASVPWYLSGPCAGKSAGTCTFDSMIAYYNPDGSRDFAVTAYGKYWNWNSPSRGVFNLTGSGDLISVPWYASGPCAGKSAGTCTFDSMIAYYNPDGSRDFAVTAYGKYWNWNSPSRGVFNLTGSGDLISVPWYIK